MAPRESPGSLALRYVPRQAHDLNLLSSSSHCFLDASYLGRWPWSFAPPFTFSPAKMFGHVFFFCSIARMLRFVSGSEMRQIRCIRDLDGCIVTMNLFFFYRLVGGRRAGIRRHEWDCSCHSVKIVSGQSLLPQPRVIPLARMLRAAREHLLEDGE